MKPEPLKDKIKDIKVIGYIGEYSGKRGCEIEDIKSAVEWLREATWKSRLLATHEAEVIDKLIDKAFQDVTNSLN